MKKSPFRGQRQHDPAEGDANKVVMIFTGSATRRKADTEAQQSFFVEEHLSPIPHEEEEEHQRATYDQERLFEEEKEAVH